MSYLSKHSLVPVLLAVVAPLMVLACESSTNSEGLGITDVSDASTDETSSDGASGGNCGTALCVSGEYCETFVPGAPCSVDDDAGDTDSCSVHTCKKLPVGCTDCGCLTHGHAVSCQKSVDGFLRVTVAGP